MATLPGSRRSGSRRGRTSPRRGRSAPVGLIGALVLVVPPPASSQHAPDEIGSLGLEADGCQLCHGTHVGARFGLKTDPESRAARPGVGTISESCLRCHADAGRRSRQPEFRTRSAGPGGGRFLGADLADDHPLGRTGDAPLALFGIREGLAAADVLRNGVRSLEATDGAMECTLCHDPHDPQGARPDAELLRELCTSCHAAQAWASETHRDVPCNACHRLHGAGAPHLLASPSLNRTCNRCHDPTSSPAPEPGRFGSGDPNAAIAFGVVADLAPRAHARRIGGDCIDCHPQHR